MVLFKDLQNTVSVINHNVKIKADFEDLRRLKDRFDSYTPLANFKVLQNSMFKYALNERVKNLEERIIASNDLIEDKVSYDFLNQEIK